MPDCLVLFWIDVYQQQGRPALKKKQGRPKRQGAHFPARTVHLLHIFVPNGPAATGDSWQKDSASPLWRRQRHHLLFLTRPRLPNPLHSLTSPPIKTLPKPNSLFHASSRLSAPPTHLVPLPWRSSSAASSRRVAATAPSPAHSRCRRRRLW